MALLARMGLSLTSPPGIELSLTPQTAPQNTPSQTQTGGEGGVLPNKPPVSTTPPLPERDDGLGKLSGRNIRVSE